MFRTKYQAPGTAPATLIPHKSPDEVRKTVVHVIQYDPTTFSEWTAETPEEAIERHDPSLVNWYNIDGLDVDVLRKFGERFSLHPLALEDVLNTTQRPKLEPYADHIFIVTQMVYIDDELYVCGEQVSLFLGKDYVITVQEELEGDVFNPLRERLRQARGFARRNGPDYLAYALLDAIVDHLFPILETIGDSIEELEEELLEKPSEQIVRKLHEIKRTLLHLRRAAFPEREVLSALTREDTVLIQPQTKIFLRDCYDHTVQIIDLIESYRDLLGGMMDIYLSSISMRTNDVMRVLTVISAIFIPLTFIAGVYGMNFDTKWPLNMPELEQPYGYVGCVGGMLLIATGQLIFFRHKKWL